MRTTLELREVPPEALLQIRLEGIGQGISRNLRDFIYPAPEQMAPSCTLISKVASVMASVSCFG
jgi:hypothetical protein